MNGKNADKVVINERGKRRVIVPVKIGDRITQKVICDNCLSPIIYHYIIYDNCASVKGKGCHFARERINKMLVSAMKEYGSDFYVLKFDFKDYFASIPHNTCLKILSDLLSDRKIIGFIMAILKSYAFYDTKDISDIELKEKTIEYIKNNKANGLCLGSQVSQLLAIFIPNYLDHMIKDKKENSYYIRYMDDGVIIGNNKEELKELLIEMKNVISLLGLQFNDKKTYITKITHGFTFLKIRYFIDKKSGKLVKKMERKNITRMRCKLKKYRHLVDNGDMTLDDVYASMQSWLDSTKYTNSYHTKKSMLKLYDSLFGGYKITRYWKHKNCITSKQKVMK